MEPRRMLAELEALAARVGVEVRAEAFDTRVIPNAGGLCWLRGEPVIVLDAYAPIADRVAVMAGALATFDLEAIYVPPLLRARIKAAARGPHARRA